jgi:hypothetical protein
MEFSDPQAATRTRIPMTRGKTRRNGLDNGIQALLAFRGLS